MAKKDKSAVISGAGWIASFADKLIRRAKAKGVPDEQIHSLVTDTGDEAMDVLVDTVIERCFKKFDRDMTKEGWTLLEEDTREPRIISAGSLELVPFLKEGESYIDGEELVRRARRELRANLGQRHAEYLLTHQTEIPEEFRKYILVFPGTIWRGDDHDRGVPFLDWDDGRWYLDFLWLVDSFGGGYRLLRPRE